MTLFAPPEPCGWNDVRVVVRSDYAGLQACAATRYEACWVRLRAAANRATRYGWPVMAMRLAPADHMCV